jgi:TrmH RNA methyltransferase
MPSRTAQPALDQFYGLNTCLALWEHRADDIVRLFVTEERLKKLGKVLQWCAKRKRPYHVVTPDDLERITKSVHHEGVAVVMRPQISLNAESLLAWTSSQPTDKPIILVYLDGVKNPHNIGSIIRTAAHFGCPHILGRLGELPRLSPSAARVAEGGIMSVNLVPLEHPEETLKLLTGSFGFTLVGTTSPTAVSAEHLPKDGKQDEAHLSVFAKPLPKRMIVVFGNEILGMSSALKRLIQQNIFIPGTGRVESLNVAIAAGVVFGEYWRIHDQTAPQSRS